MNVAVHRGRLAIVQCAAAALLAAAALAGCGTPQRVVRPLPSASPAPVYAPAPEPAPLPIRPAPVPLPAPAAEPMPAETAPLETVPPPVPMPAPGWPAAAPLEPPSYQPGAAPMPLPMAEPPLFGDLPPGPMRIALVLPLDSAAFGEAAQAVAAGFTAAAQHANTPVTIIPHGDGGVLPAIDQARQEGATVIVGPLLRDDLKAVAAAGMALPWTIALNQLDDGTPLPGRIYTLALSVEGEARQVAQAMQAEGVRDVAIVASDAPLQRRFASSFTDFWLLQGGGRPSMFGLVRDPESLALLRTELARTAADAVLLAATGGDAALVKPYLPHVPVYASSQVHDRQPTAMLRDLDGIRFVEVPLVGDPDAPNLAGVPRRDWPNPTLERLYALGYDAFHVALAFDRGPPQRLDFDGATGHLTLEPDHRIAREGRLMRFEDGRVVASDRP